MHRDTGFILYVANPLQFQQAAEVRAVLPDFIRLICLTEII